jgi:hypothetical protein
MQIIKRVNIKFIHDSGEEHEQSFDLSNPEDIAEMASFIQDYYVVEFIPVTLIKF